MVAMDDERQPAAVPKLVPVTPDEIRRSKAAQVRRQLRQEFEQRATSMKP